MARGRTAIYAVHRPVLQEFIEVLESSVIDDVRFIGTGNNQDTVLFELILPYSNKLPHRVDEAVAKLNQVADEVSEEDFGG
jgi:hypothetical protein